MALLWYGFNSRRLHSSEMKVKITFKAGNFYPSISAAGMDGYSTGTAKPGVSFWLEREDHQLDELFGKWVRDGAVEVLSVEPPVGWPNSLTGLDQPNWHKYRDIDWPWGGS